MAEFNAEEIATEVCREVAELSDRGSPEDWPEAMLVTADELRSIVMAALSTNAGEAAEQQCEQEVMQSAPWNWLRGVINGLPSTPSGCYELIARHDVLAWIDEGEHREIEAALAQPAPVQQEAAQYLLPDDLTALGRFIETTEDDQSYDIGKAAIKRLAELGVVQSHNFGRYSITAFGHWVHEKCAALPLLLNSDRDARHRAALQPTQGAGGA